MNQLQAKIPTDKWIVATWDQYLKIIAAPLLDKASCYYHNGKLRIEMPPLGHDYACDNTIISFAINLFCTLKGIPIKGLTNCTYRKTGIDDCQPDLSYYVRDNAQVVPWKTRIIDLDQYPIPTLFVEVADTSLADDKGEKRLHYEDLKVAEYWIVDVENIQILAFAIADGGSRRISESLVLPGLKISANTDIFTTHSPDGSSTS